MQRFLQSTGVVSWTLASPVVLILTFFLLLPIGMIVAVSFWGSNEFSIFPAFQFDNYDYLFGSSVVRSVFLKTFMFAAITWAITLVIGFTVAYFLTFHVHTLTWQVVLFMLCTIPFLTSNIIRMISWVPFLGRNGIANATLIDLGLTDEPLEWLLFSEFAVILAFVHLYVLFMVVPIFNTMMRIDKSLIDAAGLYHHPGFADRGGARWRGVGVPDPDQCGHSADQTRHHDRVDLCGRTGHGRFHHGAVHVGLAGGQCRAADFE